MIRRISELLGISKPRKQSTMTVEAKVIHADGSVTDYGVIDTGLVDFKVSEH